MRKRVCEALFTGLVVFFGFCLPALSDEWKPLVSVAWLQENLLNPGIIILDIRSPNARGNPYLQGHIPGARHAPYNTGWRERRDGVIGMLPEERRIVSHIRSLGVNSTSHVVIVPHGQSSTDFGAATRVYWTFKVLGHKAVSILDGGYKAWGLEGGALSKDSAHFSQGNFDGKIDTRLLTAEGEVQQSLRGGKQLVDARPVTHFEGRVKSPVVQKAGTIPGSYNMKQSLFYDPNAAKFASRERLEELTIALGLSDPTAPTIAFCNTGHWASLAWFALHEIAGREDVSLYDGSMAEWTRNEGNPVVVSAE